ncbi:unnamed protein product [Penicillium salamii]|uniref:Uncharacterized protein n=1 Tax=Penicillium salamii TaxID=1612424 RepID=A0A9W4JSK7_9EURO|nr:unnamed protein product [Penicillium salamii]CAG8211669.1 unnamed protein product [Penicillium salamii]CAG8225441.1 unnamed protein product [Penicillium salamii]CAG8232462.1 unnamed protein product [Penicillium salamii]CAG8245557.1 unnamed protein product [Penicillium salamii]
MDFLQSTSNASQSSTSELSCSGFSSVEYEAEDPLAQLAKEVKQQPFTTNKSLQKSLERRQRALEQDQTRDQYLVITSVSPMQAFRLSDERSPTSKYCRFFFNTETGILIAKVKLNFAHEVAIGHFSLLINLELNAMEVLPDMTACGSTTVKIGNWKKEADSCWAPTLTNPRLSFVVEVGLSESTRQLALSARSWLETYSSSVKLVVTISTKQENPEIILHRWELVPRRSGVLTRSSPPSARCTSFLKLSRTNNTTSVTGESYMDGTTRTTTQLDLPFNKVANRPPHPPLERDLVIPEQELRSFAEKIWRVQGLL